MLRVHQIKLMLDEDITLLKQKCADKLRIPVTDIIEYQIVRESLDARKHPLCFSYTVDVSIKNEKRCLHRKDVQKAVKYHYEMPKCGSEKAEGRVIVAGFGPAGMYAALLLAQMGYRPLVLEKGEMMEQRIQSVQQFWHNGTLNPESNVQFGEGGAGTFSDGKLTSRSKDPRSHKVLAEFVRFGAHSSILYEAYPHIGTDRLRGIVVNMRKEISRLGGEIRFSAALCDINIQEGQITHVKADKEWIPCKALILAVGHSARDIFAMLAQKQVAMQQKSFAVGVRIEHPQAFINEAQYKAYAKHPRLKAASYRLSYTTKKGRGVYSFCMCPGGSVVNSSSEHNALVVNGMSEYARDRENANSAILVQVNPEDIGRDIMAGIQFQQDLERKAYQIGKGYFAPVQRLSDFLQRQASVSIGKLKPTILPGYTLCDLHMILPSFVSDALAEAFVQFDHQLRGFLHEDAILTGIETRSSSPLRILRNSDTLTSPTLSNLYPCAEGAGYAGGIVSAAIDGLRCSEKVIERFQSDYSEVCKR